MSAELPTLPPGDAPSDRSAGLRWLVPAACGVGLLFLATVHAPQRAKLPLVTPLVLGVVAGWGLGRWALACRTTSPRFVAIASFALIAAGAVGMALETHRLGRRELQRSAGRSPLPLAGQDLSPADPGLADRMRAALLENTEDQATRDELIAAQRRQEAELERRRRLLTFPGYLEHRIPKAWGRWPAPWPELFWGAEVLLAAALGAGLAVRSGRLPG